MAETPSSHEGERIAGILVPVFAIRTETDLGIGDISGVRQMIDWADGIGMRFLQFLPINEMAGDCSPYNAISSVAIDPLTLDVSPSVIPELKEDAWQAITEAADLESLREGDVQYGKVRLLKSELLWAGYEVFKETHLGEDTEREQAFLKFCEEEKAWLKDYCVFRLFMGMEGHENWEIWTEDYNTLDKAQSFLENLLANEPESTEHQLAWYAWVQFIAYGQWREIAEYATSKAVRLMGDIPFGVSRCSADVFSEPRLFDLSWCGGAPPETNFKDDEFTMKWGQNWGIPLYRWDVMKQDGYAWWKQRTAMLCKVFALFRIDHVLGFYRIYSFPFRPERNLEFLKLTPEEAREKTGGRDPGFKPRPDDSEENMRLNREEGEEYLRVLKEAAGGADIVAEDLGMVPPYVPGSLESLGIPGMKVPMWDTVHYEGEFRDKQFYPWLSLATYATHDHEPIRTQWAKHQEIVANDDPQEEVDSSRHFLHRWARYAQFHDAIQDVPPAWSDEVREILLKALFESSSRYASVMITDLLGLEDRFNVPGIASDANWTRRLPMTMAELQDDPQWAEKVEGLKKLLKDAGRTAEDSSEIG